VNESLVDSIGIYVGTEPEKVVLQFSGWAATVVSEHSWHPSQSIRKQGDGSLELKFKVAINPEFERWLWSWGDAIEVISPGRLRDRI